MIAIFWFYVLGVNFIFVPSDLGFLVNLPELFEFSIFFIYFYICYQHNLYYTLYFNVYVIGNP